MEQGAAISKMIQLTRKIYETTPDMESAFPKKQSKILAGIKQEDEVGPKRARKFMKKCEQIE